MATVLPLKPVRRSCRPTTTDSLESIARRELPDASLEAAIANLRAWNPHLSRGRRDFSQLLVSDVVFLEAPPKPSKQGGW